MLGSSERSGARSSATGSAVIGGSLAVVRASLRAGRSAPVAGERAWRLGGGQQRLGVAQVGGRAGLAEGAGGLVCLMGCRDGLPGGGEVTGQPEADCRLVEGCAQARQPVDGGELVAAGQG